MENYLDIIKRNNELGNKLNGAPAYKIGVLSNIILNQLKEPLELSLRRNNIHAVVEFGDYDNITQDSIKFKSHNALILFWEAGNIIDGLNYKSLSMSEAELDALIAKVKSELALVIENLKDVPIVVMNKFSSLLFNQYFIKENNFDYLVNSLNKYLAEALPANFFFLDIDKVIAQTGVNAAFNRRFWYSSKMLYTVDMLKNYAGQVAPVFLNILGKTKKALILDCDNTLWKGIIGEDLIDGIAYSGNQKDGIYFEEVQYLAKALSAQGIMLGVNSKNNPEDVEAVLTKGEDITLKKTDFLVRKINWRDKVSNLKEIAEELNIGVDSLVQMDDSDFEINYIKTELPAVETIQVPKLLTEYPEVFRKKMNLFFNLKTTNEDTSRVKMYKEQQQRDDEKGKFSTLEDYLQSLELEITVRLNDAAEIPRIAQMTQKTNQFNLTTRRYTEGEIKGMMEDGKHYIFSFSLKDKFGEYGITGLCIVEEKNLTSVNIDTLLMSCRIIGRNIEKAFFNFLTSFLQTKGVATLKGKYVKTLKNAQVENLFEQFGMELVSKQEKEKNYQLSMNGYHPSHIKYITIKNGA